MNDEKPESILRIAILAMKRSNRGKEFFACEVIKSMFPQNWEYFREELMIEIKELKEEGYIEICNSGLKEDFSNIDFIKIKFITKL